MTNVINTEDFKALRESKERENAPQIRGVHPERQKAIVDQINHRRVQSSQKNEPSVSGLNEMIQDFRRYWKRGYGSKCGIESTVKRFDSESCIVRCRIVSPEGKTLSEAHAAWDKDLIYSADFINASAEEVELFQSTANRDRLEICENIACSRALRMLGI